MINLQRFVKVNQMALPKSDAVNPSDAILDFLLSKPSPEDVLALRPSEEVQERLSYLLDGNRNDALSDAEKGELARYLELEHFVRRLKIRAQEILAS